MSLRALSLCFKLLLLFLANTSFQQPVTHGPFLFFQWTCELLQVVTAESPLTGSQQIK